jgi:sialate O-acetylesterase
MAALVLVSTAGADVRLPRVIGANMVLQRDTALPIWGWAAPGESVTVTIAGQEAKATADGKGLWRVNLAALPAGGPHEMVVAGKNQVKLPNIMVGEVWLCSGQSNMAMTVSGVRDGEKEAQAANFPNIRLFSVPRRPAGEPMSDVDGAWSACAPGTAGGFSAVAYFFGRKIHQELNVPVGLINSSWGGTRIEPWTPPEGFAAVPKIEALSKQVQDTITGYRQNLPKGLEKLEAWIAQARKALADGEVIPDMPNVGHPLGSHTQPTGLYNGMIHGLVPFAIRGALWYQGEGNRGDGMGYAPKMEALIKGWRGAWKQGDFPFYYVQLAPYRFDISMARIWEGQAAAQAVPNAGMAVTVDIGDLNDIHPRNKQDVGLRLALLALARDYGRKEVVCSGPVFKDFAVEDDKARVRFEGIGGGLVASDGKPLVNFEVAGEDKAFVDAAATIDGVSVLVSSPKVPKPVAVRYLWKWQAQPNLANKEGLPAAPFRTDDW